MALETLPQMAADDAGLVHGGFVFGLADYAAMLAVNHPHVVLAGATVRLHKPVAVGQRLVAEANVANFAGAAETAGRRSQVTVEVSCEGAVVMSGTFDCVTLDRHVLAPAPGGPGEEP